jgi:uncharacterized protein YhaN
MRITRFDLLRYGKFTDKSVVLPRAPKDFHLIIGPNEAGKSTLRSAVQDLLFGIETRSRYNFIHPHNEMRLGALIEQGDTTLDFVRTKARTKTLHTADGSALPDNALTPFLGSMDRAFFDHMFGLNHERLVTGGQEILNASNDIGQILFQAAAGIGSLGEVRDRLEAEAEKLWAKRKSGDREYYIAAAELEQAEVALKQATVRTKDWQEARAAVDQIGEALQLARERFQAVELERMQLERVRRVAPLLTKLQELELQLSGLGDAIALPENASAQLTDAEHAIALSTQSLLHFDQQSTELQAQISALQPNHGLLAQGDGIEALTEMRQRLRNHESDILKRESEIRVLWQEVQETARQLDWPDETEDATARRLPGSLVQSTIDGLVRRHAPLALALANAGDALTERQAEVKAVCAEIDALPAYALPPALSDALNVARALGDVPAQAKRFETQLARLQREMDAATLTLGQWTHDAPTLSKLQPPTQDETQALIRQRADLEQLVSAVNERLADAQVEAKALTLETSQYKAAHKPVTLADVQAVRSARDTTWQSIKGGTAALDTTASGFEKEIAESDSLSDQRHDRAQEETELQTKLDRQQRLQLQMSDLALRAQEHAQALVSFDQRWSDQAQAIGLTGMPLLKVSDWRAARERALGAAAALLEAQSAQQEFAQTVDQAAHGLRDALSHLPTDTGPMPLSALVTRADDAVTIATRTQERHDTLTSQRVRAEVSIPDLDKRLSQTEAAMEVWQADWQKNLGLSHLPADTDIGAVESALTMFERMGQHLQKIRDLRVTRIDMMRRDLNEFDNAAKALATAVSPAMAADPSAQIAFHLEAQLKLARTAFQELERLKAERAKTQGLEQNARADIAVAKGGLEPLLHLAQTDSNDVLRAAILRSDRQRQLVSDGEQTNRELILAGDGLDRAAMDAEFRATDVTTIAMRLAEFKTQIDAVVEQQNRLSAEFNTAEVELGKISGQSEAAKAESQRQEALARMANAVERYIKVYTAAKLLRWSIERFRESKQGPMLTRASEVFCGLTQSAFSRLVVDFESEPLKLSGQRATSELVDIDSMSEGTRDQLYLALRLAALELHLEQTTPMPFIADDLFINYDDGRSRAGLEALATLSEKTQVIFLSHHAHLVPLAQSVLGDRLNVVHLT